MDTKAQDVGNILKLYEMRRDEALRRARAWYLTEFNPATAADIVAVMTGGFESSANYRMVTSYWDMACSFVNNGGIDERMFLDANGEHTVVFSRIEPFIAEVREMFGEPDYLIQLERLVMKAPNAKEILARRRRLLERWSKAARKSAS